jgi:hypothetical protein
VFSYPHCEPKFMVAAAERSSIRPAGVENWAPAAGRVRPRSAPGIQRRKAFR